MLNQNDKQILCELASRYASYALLPAQGEKKLLWEKLNTFSMERPMVLFDQLPWHELDVDGFLVNRVSDPYWAWVETGLRREIYKWEHLPADMVLNPYILLPRPLRYTGYGIAAHVTTAVTDINSDVRAQSYECLFKNMEDIEKIQTPSALPDTAAETAITEQADALFAGIIPWKFGGVILHLGFWDFIAQWMGVEQVYVDLYDNPELLHGIMERLTSTTEEYIKQLGRDGLYDVCLANVCHCSHTFLPNDKEHCEPVPQNGWAFGLAQLFTSVSPSITDEFEVPYMKRLFPYFANIYYGCCDRLDDRLDIVAKMPNIRKISCSPWSIRENFASKLPRDKIMSVKPNPALFAPFSAEAARADIRDAVQTAKRHGCCLELIFKDVSTVKYRPESLWEMSKIALEEVCRA